MADRYDSIELRVIAFLHEASDALLEYRYADAGERFSSAACEAGAIGAITRVINVDGPMFTQGLEDGAAKATRKLPG